MEIILDYPDTPNVITRVLIRERERQENQRRCDHRQSEKEREERGRERLREKERFQDTTQVAFNMEERANKQGMQAASRS